MALAMTASISADVGGLEGEYDRVPFALPCGKGTRPPSSSDGGADGASCIPIPMAV